MGTQIAEKSRLPFPLRRLRRGILPALPFVGFGLAAVATPVRAQNARFAPLSIEDGLSQTVVNAITQDSTGFLWFGTQDGLNKYDGNGFTVFRTERGNRASLSNNWIWTLYRARTGALWVGTNGGGVNRFDPHTVSFTRYEHVAGDPTSLSDDVVQALHEDPSGDMWVGTLRGGLNRFDRETETFTAFRHDPADPTSLDSDDVRAVLVDRDGRLWVGTARGGLHRRDPGTVGFTHYRHDPSEPRSLSDDFVTVLFEDRAGRLWVGTQGGGLNQFEPTVDGFTRFPSSADGLQDDAVTSIDQDPTGILWIGTRNGGLHRFDPSDSSAVAYQHDPLDRQSLPRNDVRSIFRDLEGSLWVGTYTGGVARLDRSAERFAQYRNDPYDPLSLSHNVVWAVLPESTHVLWVGTQEGGLNRIDRSTGMVRRYPHDPRDLTSVSHTKIRALAEDRDGLMWVATDGGGLNAFDRTTGTFARYRHDPADSRSLSGDRLRAIYEDREGTLWVGTFGDGLNRFDKRRGTFERFRYDAGDAHSLSHNDVRGIYEDGYGILWVLTSGGLNQFDRATRRFTAYRFDADDPGSLSHDVVRAIFEDSAGRLWVGTRGGLNRLHRETGTFTAYTIADGLPSNVIYSVMEAADGALWLSTTNGLSRFDPAAGTFRNFDVSDGLPSTEFAAGSFAQGVDGELIYGSVQGVHAFHPDDVTVDAYEPPVVLTDLRLFSETVPVARGTLLPVAISGLRTLRLSHREHTIGFEFAALSFVAPQRNRYAYRLDGFNEAWMSLANKRDVTFTNLDPGSYVLRVRGSNKDGVWSPQEAGLGIVITPPLWQTWWFRTVAGLVVALAVLAGYKTRVRQIEARNRLLEREVASRTAHLERTLTELKETKDELVEVAHRAGMADIATNVLHNVGNLLNSVTTSASVIQDTIARSRVGGLARANGLLRTNRDDLATFLTDGDRGEKLIHYYNELERGLQVEQNCLRENSARLEEHVHRIVTVINAQEKYTNQATLAEPLSLEDVVRDVLDLSSASLQRHGVEVTTAFAVVPAVEAHRTKLVHVLTNLIRNAKEAMETVSGPKRLTIAVGQDEDVAYVRVTDTGIGVPADACHAVFALGHTTKGPGRGFGLHSSASYMVEMGGEIQLEDADPDSGATFVIRLPLSS